MGTVVEFPSDAASLRPVPRAALPQAAMGQVVILPVVRIERYTDETSGGRDPDQGAAPGRRRRRRARS